MALFKSFRFTIQVIRGRWFMLFATFLIMSVAGATYIFSIYSKDMKSSLSYDQQTLNTLSFFKDLGANVGIVSGLINEVTPPSVVLVIGSLMNLFGYLMIYLAITHKIPKPALWQMCLYICVGANSQTFSNTGGLVTAVKNFPEHRGIVLGLVKGFVGLSGAIYTQLYHAFYGDDSESLVLLVAWLPAAVSIAFVGTVRIIDVVKTDSKERTRPYYLFLYISLALAFYLMVVIVLEKVLDFTHVEYGLSAIVVVSLLFLPLFVVIKEEIRVRGEKQREMEKDVQVVTSEKDVQVVTSDCKTVRPSSECDESTDSSVSCVSEMFKPPGRGEDYSILQALVSVDMIVLFVTMICGVGGTLTAIDNMGQIGQSLGYPSKSVGTFVSLISIWNYAGRVASGFLSEMAYAKYNFPRPLLLTLVLLFSCVGHLLIAFGVPNSLYVASVIIGFCFGAQWPLLFAIISEIFGLKYYSTLYNLGGAASPVGSYLLNVKVAGYLYDLEAAKQNGGLRNSTCFGVNCFKKSFLIITGTTVAGVLISLILVWRSWNFYKSDIYAKFRATDPEINAVESVKKSELLLKWPNRMFKDEIAVALEFGQVTQRLRFSK